MIPYQNHQIPSAGYQTTDNLNSWRPPVELRPNTGEFIPARFIHTVHNTLRMLFSLGNDPYDSRFYQTYCPNIRHFSAIDIAILDHRIACQTGKADFPYQALLLEAYRHEQPPVDFKERTIVRSYLLSPDHREQFALIAKRDFGWDTYLEECDCYHGRYGKELAAELRMKEILLIQR